MASDVLLCHCLFYSFEAGSLTLRQGLSPELSDVAKLAGRKSPSILPSSGFTSTGGRIHFYVGIEIRTQIPRLAHQVLAQPLSEHKLLLPTKAVN